MPAEIYNTERFGQLYYASRAPASLNLDLAQQFITSLLDASSIDYACMGGWALQKRGSTRTTTDVDIVVRASMETLRTLLIQQTRVCFPQAYGSTSVTIFVHTGQGWDSDCPHVTPLAVHVDIIVSGNLHTPIDLRGVTELISTSHGSVRILNTYFQTYTKFGGFMDRGCKAEKDFEDLVFLLSNHWQQ
ncbi:hypothetical protein P152DRAFT_414281, partial [Eremomyces bilateralis CBS 781.70]